MSAPPSAAFWLSHVAFNTTSWASIWGTDENFCDALIEHLTPEAKAHLRFLVGRMDDDDDDALFGTARSREDTGPHGTLRKQTRAGALAALATPVDARPTPASIPEEDELEPTDNDDDDDAPLLDDDIEDDDDDEEEAEAAAAAARARRRAVPPIASEDDDEPVEQESKKKRRINLLVLGAVLLLLIAGATSLTLSVLSGGDETEEPTPQP